MCTCVNLCTYAMREVAKSQTYELFASHVIVVGIDMPRLTGTSPFEPRQAMKEVGNPFSFPERHIAEMFALFEGTVINHQRIQFE